MERLRPFRNTDPPYLVDIWRSQPPCRGLAQPVSVPLLEERVFSQRFFVREGLIVAAVDGRPVGFVHSAFGPSKDGSQISTEVGVICMLMVHHSEETGGGKAALENRLLASSEQYLCDRGARVLMAIGNRYTNPFYLGFYGGSQLPGVLNSDEHRQTLYRAGGYREVYGIRVLQCDLTRFQPVINRRQSLLRRKFRVQETFDPPLKTWWETCTMANFSRTRFDLVPKNGGDSVAYATFWDVQPLASCWGISTAGLLDLSVDPRYRRKGLAIFLMCEACKQLTLHGISLVEAQLYIENVATTGLCCQLGFTEVDRGAVLEKSAESFGR